MAITKPIESITDGICENAYTLIEKIEYTNFNEKKGSIKIGVYNNEDTRKNTSKRKCNSGILEFGKDEILDFNHEENKGNSFLSQLDISEIQPELDALISKVYTVLKTKNNIQLETGIVDLTDAKDLK